MRPLLTTQIHKKRALLIGAGTAVLLVLLAARIAWHAYRDEYQDYVRTASTETSRHPERVGIDGLQEVSFTPPGGAAVAGWYAPSKNRAAVILVHGTEAERSALLDETKILAAAGFGVLAIDMPGQGASGGKTEWGEPERRAISGAVDWLSHRDEVDPARIGAFGLSMGAYVVAQTAVLDPRIAAVVLAASPHDVKEFNWVATRKWGWLSQLPTMLALKAGGTPTDMTPKSIVGRIAPRPLLIVQGDRDDLVLPWMGEEIYAAAREPKEIYRVHGAGHGNYAQAAPREYAAHLLDFFSKSLLPRKNTDAGRRPDAV